jgi:hypothetical protein
MMGTRRTVRELQAAILAAVDGKRGLSLSPPEVELLAKQPFVSIDPELAALEWRPVPGFERYEVSEWGHVRRGHNILKQTRQRYGHRCVTVYSAAGKQWRAGVHSLVAVAFLGPAPEGKPFACHKNGYADENYKDNIYWGSRQENVADMVRHASLKRDGGRSLTAQSGIEQNTLLEKSI